ncbi:hypothetical protein ACP70R_038228 [Stipagrostis hirtigluma subsp. patula]
MPHRNIVHNCPYSPRCHYSADAGSDKYGSLDGNNGQYTGMVIFPMINIDEDKFEYASKMLDTIRYAFMAYGLQEKRMKHTDMILKLGIMLVGIRELPNYSELNSRMPNPPSFTWVRTLFTPMRKSMTGSSNHPYAPHHPEPLAHFALSTGAYSDPPVRLYTAKKIYH